MRCLRISNLAGGRPKQRLSAKLVSSYAADHPILFRKVVYAIFTALAVLVILAGTLLPTSP